MKFKTARYDKIIKELVNTSFPILKNKRIKTEKVLFPKFFKFSASARMKCLFRKELFISINPKYCENYNNFELKGVFAHELCHLEDFITSSLWMYFILGAKYIFSKNYREKYEKATDTKAIFKGYRKELKAYRIKRRNMKDKSYKKIKKFYLTPGEIDKVKN